MSKIIDLNTRKQLLQKLHDAILSRETEVLQALKKDLGKPEFEAFVSEFQYVLSDIKYTIKNLNRWAKPQKVWPSLLNFPSREQIESRPYGRVLIIAPWNYPFQLAISPLVAAIAAGNTVVVKPSEITYHTGQVLSQIIQSVFDVKQAVVVHGDYLFTQSLLEKKWNYIFFTGSVRVGKIVAQAAAKHLTPTTLELGGKNPCVVHHDAPLPLAARRIVWGKFFNAGQTCIAPDYLLVHKSVKAELIELLKIELERAYGENPQESKDLGRIVNDAHFTRLTEALQGQNILHGGTSDALTRHIAPTLIDEPALSSALMQDEIFGPLLPIISYENEADLKRIISQYETPLALYVFSKNNDFIEKTKRHFDAGGVCINDCMLQFANKRLPFGGMGESGIGAYHGRFGFDTFSHRAAVVRRSTAIDIPLRYAPYSNKLKKFRSLLLKL